MTLCSVQNVDSDEHLLMTANYSTPISHLSDGKPVNFGTLDTSQNSVRMSQLQLLKHSIYSDTCVHADHDDNQTKITEPCSDSSVGLDTTPQWIIRACRGLWEQIYAQMDEKTEAAGDGIQKWQPSGSNLVTGLIQVCGKSDRLLATGVWQILVDESVITPVDGGSSTKRTDCEFIDRDDVLYRCTCSPESAESFLHDSVTIPEDRDEMKSSSAPEDKTLTSSSPLTSTLVGFRLDSLELDDKPQPENKLLLLIDRLYDQASDAIFRRVLQKKPAARTQKELDFVFHELHLVPALSGLSRNVRRELSRCLLYEIHPEAGITVFSQGDPGTSWYIIHRGSVWVYVKGQGPVCRLSEGDDFGKLALVTGAPRAASIVLAENNCHFLKVQKDDFDRILRDVEANIVRLKEQESDVLILERLLDTDGQKSNDTSPSHKEEHLGKKSSNSRRFINYSIKAGTTEKIVQHLLDVRLGGIEQQVDILLDSEKTPICLCPRPFIGADSTFEDFILTYSLFTTEETLFDLLMVYTQSNVDSSSPDAVLYVNRVLVFLYSWCQCIGLALFAKISHVYGFLKQLQKYIDQRFPSSVQSKITSRILLECEAILLKVNVNSSGNSVLKVQGKDPVPTSTETTVLRSSSVTNVATATASNVTKATTTTNSLPVSSTTLPLPIRRSASSRMRFTCIRPPGLSSSKVPDPQSRCTTTGQFCRQHKFNECATRFSHVDVYPPVTGHCIFLPNTLPFSDRLHLIKFPVYFEGGRKKHWLSMQLGCTVAEIKQELSQYLPSTEDISLYKLVEVSSKGDRLVFEDWERGIVLGLSPNSCLFMAPADKAQSLVPLPIQLAVAMNFLENHEHERPQLNQELHHKDVKSSSPMLRRMASTGATLRALDELSVNEVATILTMTNVRVAHTCFAILLGLNSSPVARLTHTWERVPMRWRRVYFNRLVPLIDPARNHRAARTWTASTRPPHLPFLALILKDLRFAQDANETYYSEQTGSVRLINFDKMRLISQSVRLWNRAISGYEYFHPQINKLRTPCQLDHIQTELGLLQKMNELQLNHVHSFFENLECIDDIRLLTQLSLRLEPKRC
ncbi:Rap guanine nucleotide exchange factor 4 [Fasciola gigantica]|uniref:Rap guanine nucleotide exchange factor 4 n=1 Tax=Fasciola gigantica TaxID=46835 RepID=A0A504YIY6_FASGI|nr:Rap guanine nucleotide exchange factor 4 [Fasciola gigantica]